MDVSTSRSPPRSEVTFRLTNLLDPVQGMFCCFLSILFLTNQVPCHRSTVSSRKQYVLPFRFSHCIIEIIL
jgi:hypothetical protein